MKRFCISIFVLLTFLVGKGQVQWNFFVKKISDKTYQIYLKAIVDEPWHIYSQNSPKGGPLPTKIVFAKNPLMIFQGKIKEQGETENYHDKTFDVDVYSFIHTVDFIQTVKLKANVKTTVNGTIEFMACTKQKCLTPQKLKFSIKLE
jgi:hypothetical protein